MVSSAFNLRILLFFGLGMLIAAAVLTVVIICIVHYANKKKPLPQNNVPHEVITPRQEEIRKTLAQTLKELRNDKNMTQEFVAESLGVTRQAVSKWENGSSEPSTSNLIAIAKLYDVAPEELLKKLI